MFGSLPRPCTAVSPPLSYVHDLAQNSDISLCVIFGPFLLPLRFLAAADQTIGEPYVNLRGASQTSGLRSRFYTELRQWRMRYRQLLTS